MIKNWILTRVGFVYLDMHLDMISVLGGSLFVYFYHFGQALNDVMTFSYIYNFIHDAFLSLIICFTSLFLSYFHLLFTQVLGTGASVVFT